MIGTEGVTAKGRGWGGVRDRVLPRMGVTRTNNLSYQPFLGGGKGHSWCANRKGGRMAHRTTTEKSDS